MKIKKAIVFFAGMVMCLTMVACGDTNNDNSDSDASDMNASITEVVEATKAQPTITEDEARRRAVDAIQDEIDSISPYSIDWGLYDFNRFISDCCSCNFDKAEYIESSDIYKISTSNGSCGVSVSLNGVDCTAGSPYKLEFTAEVTVYSNGDTHVDSFKYDVIKKF